MEAQQAGDPGEEVLVQRNDRRKRSARLGVAQPEPMLAGRIGNYDMPAVDTGQIGEQRAERARIDRRSVAETLRRGVEDNGDGGQFRAPGNRL